MLFLRFCSKLLKNFSHVVYKRYHLLEKNTIDILRTKAVLNIALSSVPKGSNESSIYLASGAPIFVRNDSMTSKESKCKKLFVNTSYVEQVMSI